MTVSLPSRALPLAALLLAAAVGGCERPGAERARGGSAVAAGGDSLGGAVLAGFAEGAAAGAVVYVPAYSHIYDQDGTREFDLAATLSVRNTDPERTLTVASVSYYDSAGHLVRDYLDAPLTLGPLASRSFVVAERDRTGGSGANFLVTWSARRALSEPLIESVMISTASAQGLSFTGQSQVVRRLGAE